MLVLRCTQKLLRRLGPPAATDVASTTRLGDWAANLVNVGHRRFVIAVAEHTRLPVLLPARDMKHVADRLVEALPVVLRALDVPDAAIDRELAEMREVALAPTNNRSVIGTLNEFAHSLPFRLHDDPDADLTDVALWLSQMPILSLGDSADRMTRALLEGDSVPRATSAAVRAFRLKVTLVDIRPPIWRRFEVPAGISLERLHRVLQIVMGWTNSHLHQFEKDRVLYGTSDREFGLERVSERKTRLSDLLESVGATLDYEYDFGDGWSHRIKLEAIVPDGIPVARVLEAKRACPPEDVGGPWGYDEFLKALASPRHSSHKEMLEWSGGGFDADAFDIEATNRKLAKLRVSIPPR